MGRVVGQDRRPRPITRAGAPFISAASLFRLAEPGDRDLVDVLEGEASDGLEEESEVARRGHEGGDGVQGGDEILPKEL